MLCTTIPGRRGPETPGPLLPRVKESSPRFPPARRSGCAGKEGFEMLTGDDAASADLEVGQLAGANLVIQQVAGEAGDCRGLIDAVGQPLVQVRAVHRFHLDHLDARA